MEKPAGCAGFSLAVFRDAGCVDEATTTNADPRGAQVAIDDNAIAERIETQMHGHLGALGEARRINDVEIDQRHRQLDSAVAAWTAK